MPASMTEGEAGARLLLLWVPVDLGPPEHEYGVVTEEVRLRLGVEGCPIPVEKGLALAKSLGWCMVSGCRRCRSCTVVQARVLPAKHFTRAGCVLLLEGDVR